MVDYTVVNTNSTALTNVNVGGYDVPARSIAEDLTLTDAEYGRYITTAARFGGPGPGCDPVTRLCNFKGNNLNQTPPYTVNVGAEYRFETEIGSITPRVDAYFSGRVDFLADNFITSRQKPYHTTNARVTWESLDRKYRVEAFVANIEDDDIISNDGLQSTSLGSRSPARRAAMR